MRPPHQNPRRRLAKTGPRCPTSLSKTHLQQRAETCRNDLLPGRQPLFAAFVPGFRFPAHRASRQRDLPRLAGFRDGRESSRLEGPRSEARSSGQSGVLFACRARALAESADAGTERPGGQCRPIRLVRFQKEGSPACAPPGSQLDLYEPDMTNSN